MATQIMDVTMAIARFAGDDMSNLDDKLREIAEDVFRAGVGTQADDIKHSEKAYLNLQKHYTTEAISQIKQAFKDENYIQVPETVINDDGSMDVRYAKKVLQNGVPLMTGQEWYEKFQNEISEWGLGAYSGDLDSVIEAAEKASGLI